MADENMRRKEEKRREHMLTVLVDKLLINLAWMSLTLGLSKGALLRAYASDAPTAEAHSVPAKHTHKKNRRG